MATQLRLFEESVQKYIVWIAGIFFSCLGCAFWLGYSIQDVKSEVAAQGASIRDINEELRVRVGIRKELMDEMRTLNTRLSHIEGQTELILKRMR